jgi:SAM-dependent methyltransferase
MAVNWEQRVYEHYVSTGNLTAHPDPALLFGPSRPYIEKVIRDHFPKDTESRVLELACGPAPFLYALKKLRYSNLTGIDVSPEQVALAHAVGLTREVSQADIAAFLSGVEPEYYDVIILFDILEHIAPSDQFDLLDLVFSRLKPGGKCIFHVPNAEGINGVRVLYSDITHKMAFTRRSIEQLLRTIGFEAIRCFEDKPIPHGFLSSIRRVIWEIIALGQVIVLAPETGNVRRKGYILSQNMLAVALKR